MGHPTNFPTKAGCQLGFIKVAMPKRTVFLEAFGEDENAVLETIHSLPLAALWNIEVFPTTPPAGVNSSGS